MLWFTILAVFSAISADCLAHNVDDSKTTPKSDVSRAKLCDLILQKLELSQRGEDKKTVIPLDNIISLADIIEKSTLKESGQLNENSNANKDLGKSSDSLADSTRRRFRGKIRRPKISGGTIRDVLDRVPDIIEAARSPSSRSALNDPSYSESKHYAPSERRLNVNPPPINPTTPVVRPRILGNKVRVIDETKKDAFESDAKENSVTQTTVPKKRVDNLTENAKITGSPKQVSNDTLVLLKHLMTKTDNVKVKSLLKTLIDNQKALKVVEKKADIKPLEVVNSLKKVDSSKTENSEDSSKIEPAQSTLNDKKPSSRRTRPIINKGKPLTDVTSNRRALDDHWDWETEPIPVIQHVPHHPHSQIIHEDKNVNKNLNVNSNVARDKLKNGRVSGRRTFLSRLHRHHDHHVDSNKNINNNINSNVDPVRQLGGGSIHELIPIRRSLDNSMGEDHNSSTDSNVNTNSNVNRQIAAKNKRRGRESRRLV